MQQLISFDKPCNEGKGLVQESVTGIGGKSWLAGCGVNLLNRAFLFLFVFRQKKYWFRSFPFRKT